MNNKIENILTLLSREGYLLSPQRLCIIKALCEREHVSDLERLWIDLRESHAVSWATVHNTVRLLESLGCLIKKQTYKQPAYCIVFPS
ncbi:hypothetical protein ACFSQ3_09940 [Sphingobacterium corticis]|uniref:Ferric uptake regulator family protein n=1 Tax=Sphingobacterium corticis TaxID=1812823 RepID=A0ABW5NJJ9_9SPHI